MPRERDNQSSQVKSRRRTGTQRLRRQDTSHKKTATCIKSSGRCAELLGGSPSWGVGVEPTMEQRAEPRDSRDPGRISPEGCRLQPSGIEDELNSLALEQSPRSPCMHKR